MLYQENHGRLGARHRMCLVLELEFGVSDSLLNNKLNYYQGSIWQCLCNIYALLI